MDNATPEGQEPYDPATDPNIPHFEFTDAQRAAAEESAVVGEAEKVVADAARPKPPMRYDATAYGIRDEYPPARNTAAERRAAESQRQLIDHMVANGARVIESQPQPATESVMHKAKGKGWLTNFLRRS